MPDWSSRLFCIYAISYWLSTYNWNEFNFWVWVIRLKEISKETGNVYFVYLCRKQQKREDTVSQYQSVRSFVCSHDVYGFSQQVSSLYKYYVLTHCSFIHFYFLLRCFDQSTVIIVTMFSKQINERLQMNERSGKAMNGNLSGFYWTYLVLLFLFFF